MINRSPGDGLPHPTPIKDLSGLEATCSASGRLPSTATSIGRLQLLLVHHLDE